MGRGIIIIVPIFQYSLNKHQNRNWSPCFEVINYTICITRIDCIREFLIAYGTAEYQYVCHCNMLCYVILRQSTDDIAKMAHST
jgi:hypothetical protein